MESKQLNPRLGKLQIYPFERLRTLLADVTPNPSLRPIDLSIGEPKHATPALVKDALTASLDGLAVYPRTAGIPELRGAIAAWARRRYALGALDAETQVLPVNGSREALFSFAQTIINPSATAKVVCPNPFYQIYEGAALLGGATPWCVNADPAKGFAHTWDAVPEGIWRRTQLLYVCSPDNPTGRVTPLATWERLFALADDYGFVIASDECYSEIYFDEAHPPLGALAAARACGRDDFARLVVFGSLSKRSNAPGLRSGYAAGDARLVREFLRYRTYHGSAMSGMVAHASIAAWNDEAHVRDN
ncbi:MAG TPA: aminotransferase class I/II-fold pyridoxal phosphate-dependent enzyme, partial [Burkholderiales bacterium]|nr:aminotransferase class I/II-fold pyridoxal phosphate-dependent enzyme [Burkholderiales bacterium]